MFPLTSLLILISHYRISATSLYLGNFWLTCKVWGASNPIGELLDANVCLGESFTLNLLLYTFFFCRCYYVLSAPA